MLLLGSFFLFIFALFVVSFLIATRGAAGEQELRIRERFQKLRAAGPSALGGFTDDLLKKSPEAQGRITLLLMRHVLAQKLETLSVQAAKPITPLIFLRNCGLCGVAGFLLGMVVLHTLLLAVTAAFVLSGTPLLLLQLQRKRRLAAVDQALPEVIEMMSRSLRAGHALVAAISIVADQAPEPARTEFAEVFRQQNFGLPLRDALLQMLDRTPSQDLRVLVTAILVQKDTGGNLTQILDRTAAVIRERLKLHGDIRVHTAQGRLTGWILCLLPIVMLLLINMINPGYSKGLTGDPFGRKLLYVGAGLLATGAFLIRRIVNGIEI